MKKLQLFGFLVLLFTGVSTASEIDPVVENCGRFSNIVFGKIGVKNETVQDTFLFINQRLLESSPNMKRFNFRLAKNEAFRGKRLTIERRNLKVYELAGIIAEQLDATITICPDGIEFFPRVQTEIGEQGAAANGRG